MGDQDPGSDEGTDFLLADEAAAVGGHPAWQEILEAVPEQYRDALKPTLEKWDKGVQSRFQSLHSKYEPFKPYVDEADKVQMGMNLIQRIEEDPRAVYDLMAATYNFAEQGATEDEGVMSEFDELDLDSGDVDPRVLAQMQALQEQQALIAQQVAEQQQRAEEEENLNQLNAYVEWLHEEHGDFDDDYVVTLLANGVEGPEAIKRYEAIIAKASGTPDKPPAPKVMPSGGGVPSRAIDPTTLSGKETKDLVAEMLIQAQQQ